MFLAEFSISRVPSNINATSAEAKAMPRKRAAVWWASPFECLLTSRRQEGHARSSALAWQLCPLARCREYMWAQPIPSVCCRMHSEPENTLTGIWLAATSRCMGAGNYLAGPKMKTAEERNILSHTSTSISKLLASVLSLFEALGACRFGPLSLALVLQ